MNWLRRLSKARSRAEMAGLELVNPAWQILGCTDPSRFFGSLSLLVQADAFIQLEGGAQPGPLRGFLESHAVECRSHPALGTEWPASQWVCLPATAILLEQLAVLTAPLPYPEVCDHLHVFAGERVLLSGYDAFSDPFYVAADVAEDVLKDFCRTAECQYQAM